MKVALAKIQKSTWDHEWIAEYPASPFDLPADILRAAYTDDDPPILREVAELGTTSVPLRRSHLSLKSNALCTVAPQSAIDSSSLANFQSMFGPAILSVLQQHSALPAPHRHTDLPDLRIFNSPRAASPTNTSPPGSSAGHDCDTQGSGTDASGQRVGAAHNQGQQLQRTGSGTFTGLEHPYHPSDSGNDAEGPPFDRKSADGALDSDEEDMQKAMAARLLKKPAAAPRVRKARSKGVRRPAPVKPSDASSLNTRQLLAAS